MNRMLLVGASGRLGREISAAAQEKGYSVIPLGRNDIENISEFFTPTKENSIFKTVIVDVSLPEGTEKIAEQLIKIDTKQTLNAWVIGTTGHSEELTQKIKMISSKTPIVLSSNFSRGVFFLEELLKAKTVTGKTVAELAKQLGFDLALWESHHTMKKDAPSGTAKTLALAAGISSDKISSTRVGSVVGEHSIFLSQGAEELRLTHVAHSRKLFADGAVDLCERILKHGLDKRLFTMSDALNQLMRS